MAHPVRAVRLASPEVEVEKRRDGAIHLRSPHALPPYPEKITEKLDYWASAAPDRVLFAQREAGIGTRWQTFTYAEVREGARRIASAFLKRNLSQDRPIVVLSGNDIEHALIELGAMYAGIPYAPISPAYSLLSTDFSKLKSIISLLTPGLVYASLEGAFGRAIETAVPAEVEVVFREDFHRLDAAPAGPEVDAAHGRVSPDTIAKFLFTSGSTGQPKAVINTQRVWCSNQSMARETLAFMQDEPPVMVEWAPWHHTAGGNKDFGVTLYNGGSLYIDEGKPLPGAIETTVKNLRDIAPTFYFNVPKGYEALLPYLRADGKLRENFFSRLKLLWFAGAGVSQHVFDGIKRLAYETCGEEILFGTGLGSTETGPFTLGRVWDTSNAANMGLPPPGVDLKLVPVPGTGAYEARIKGPHITPGYWRQPELTRQAFDEEGYYRLGDSFVFEDAREAKLGLVYRGRLSEDFKLSTGTWVHIGPLRAQFIEHFAPMVRDVVIAGEGRDDLAALVFPSNQFDARAFDEKMKSLASTGSSNRIARYAILDEPPSLDAGEVTDKGTINQKAVLKRRADIVNRVYSTSSSGEK
ncbi:MAG: feruloyl-CoA synthase [Clostridia bacterium]